ncbi:MAG: hypothetical protein ACX936_21340, partial [Marinobacter sp.]
MVVVDKDGVHANKGMEAFNMLEESIKNKVARSQSAVLDEDFGPGWKAPGSVVSDEEHLAGWYSTPPPKKKVPGSGHVSNAPPLEVDVPAAGSTEKPKLRYL